MYVVIRIVNNKIDGLYTPTVIHDSAEKAEVEALRLANKHPGVFFMVFRGYSNAFARVEPANIVKMEY